MTRSIAETVTSAVPMMATISIAGMATKAIGKMMPQKKRKTKKKRR